ncbi:LolA family protein [Alkaliphilus hydrothermalis]|uniref:Outer membrane lipoprotein-sorting protein n=1 Tax=Alkaliphilus hydrothermalis TaxID=1482730 RepID=A0ABS2NMV0_9FIRM|nr:outer membrane lipoprotein carrier protein LolA [Alkaliphilus hydrothermalis]MBM7614263.1 outer membrane lipoprotein-sorting protein [Alkaliphilus hydrothermalis]
MKFLKTALVLILLFSLIACQTPTDEELYYKAQKKLNEMEGYTTLAKIYVQRDAEEKEYIFQQTFQNPDKYRLEILAPENLKGNLTISNGKTAWIKHPAINQVWRMQDFEQSQEQLMFIGYFMRNLLNSEDSRVEREMIEGKSYGVITTSLPGGSYYFYEQKLWIDLKTLVPSHLHIVDEKGKVRFRVLYEDFVYNPKLEDSLFNLN